MESIQAEQVRITSAFLRRVMNGEAEQVSNEEAANYGITKKNYNANKGRF
jgi:hypothetical protein